MWGEVSSYLAFLHVCVEQLFAVKVEWNHCVLEPHLLCCPEVQLAFPVKAGKIVQAEPRDLGDPHRAGATIGELMACGLS